MAWHRHPEHEHQQALGLMAMPADLPPILHAALNAHDAGLCVVQASIDGSKRPLGRWRQWQTERPPRASVARWFDDGHPGFGVITGAVSGNLEMLEFEGRAVENGVYARFVEACEDNGIGHVLARIMDGYSEWTPSGGLHLLYRCTEIAGNTKLARVAPPESPNEPQPLIETRGEGGFVILAPSHGATHPSGRAWSMANGSPADIATITPNERHALWAVARTFDKWNRPDPDINDQQITLDDWHHDGESWMDATAADLRRKSWGDVLGRYGWQHHHKAGHIDYWTRPGKEAREGWSATTNAKNTDRLIVFSSATPFEPYQGGKAPSYDRLDVIAAYDHRGDRVAAARHIAPPRDGPITLGDTQGPPAPASDLLAMLIDWREFWKRDHKSEDWLAWPILPRGRQVALYAPAKTGKSIVTLAVVAAMATGKPVFGNPAQPPIDVLYLDYEMTESDLFERLEALGYGPDDDMSHLHYASLPALPPLNTEQGAQAVAELVGLTGAEAVVVDTTGRAVDGDENDATPYREFAMWTGMALKRLGVALLRTDHAGKNKDKGQRGSSAKNDDVDVVFRLDAAQDGYILTRTHSRVAWVPDRVSIGRKEDEDGFVEFTAARRPDLYPEGTKAKAAEMDALNIPLDASRDKIRAAGVSGRNKLLDNAQRYRKTKASGQGIELGDTF